MTINHLLSLRLQRMCWAVLFIGIINIGASSQNVNNLI